VAAGFVAAGLVAAGLAAVVVAAGFGLAGKCQLIRIERNYKPTALGEGAGLAAACAGLAGAAPVVVTLPLSA
jgi:hypothetical protein